MPNAVSNETIVSYPCGEGTRAAVDASNSNSSRKIPSRCFVGAEVRSQREAGFANQFGIRRCHVTRQGDLS